VSTAPTYVSLFAGAGGFDIGFDHAGFRCEAQVEIDKTARSVLARHWPDVPRYEDVRGFGKKQVKRVDVVAGGFPCQDVSTAGKRAGFAGERSSLFFEMARVVRELRPDYVVWENVPGLLTSDEGRDFLAVLVELDGLGFDGGWRTVDAQFFGVPQQRRRVFGMFARRHLGAGCAAEILALAESRSRRTPKGRKKGKGVAAPLTASLGRRGGAPAHGDTDGQFVVGYSELGEGHATFRETEAATSLRTNAGGGSQVANLVVHGGGQACGERRGNATLSAKGGTGRIDYDTENFVLRVCQTGANGDNVRPGDTAYTLNAGEPPQVVCVGVLSPDASPKGRADGVAYSLTHREGRGHGNGQAVCVTGTVTHTLTGESYDAGEDGTGRGTPIVFNWQSGGDCRLNPKDLPDALSVGQVPAVYQCHGSNVGPMGTLRAGNGNEAGGVPFVSSGSLVRRLTPRECERLMGWPDDWTRWRDTGTEIKDGPRYRLCGNGVVGTVSEWLARRLMATIRGVE
jgi:DNA (cytosine-5)-methyltransferase 1